MSITRAITLWPEWAYAILHCGKDVENRGWRIPPGRYALHAGRHIGGKPGKEAERAGAVSLIRLAVGAPDSDEAAIAALPAIRALRGCVVGVVEVPSSGGAPPRGELPPSLSPWAGYGAIDPWVRTGGERPTIANPVRVLAKAPAPVPCRGALGLWSLPPELAAVVNGWPLESS